MGNERIPNDPYGSGLDERDYNRHLDDEMRFDSDAREPMSGTKVAMFAVAIAVVLGALFYGLNNTSVQQAQTSPPAQTAQSQPQSPLQAPPGMRDVTPRANTSPGVTTGQAPQRPTAPDGNK
jgi:hypothetical protein